LFSLFLKKVAFKGNLENNFFWIFSAKTRRHISVGNDFERSEAEGRARIYDLGAKCSGIGTAKGKKKILRTTTDDGQK
jgi:hypothetical protein